jgi:hypothetical protein
MSEALSKGECGMSEALAMSCQQDESLHWMLPACGAAGRGLTIVR